MEHIILRASDNNVTHRLYSELTPSVKAKIGGLIFRITANLEDITGYAAKFNDAKSVYPSYAGTFYLVEHILSTNGLMFTEAGAGEITRFQLMAVLLYFFEVSLRILGTNSYC